MMAVAAVLSGPVYDQQVKVRANLSEQGGQSFEGYGQELLDISEVCDSRLTSGKYFW